MLAGASRLYSFVRPSVATKTQLRHRKPWLRRYLLDMWERRQLVGPEQPKPRSSKPNWNYAAELYAFGRRVGQPLSEDNLRRAFLHRCYIDREQLTQGDQLTDQGTQAVDAVVAVQDNEDLLRNGSSFLSRYVKAYLRLHLPVFPEEGVAAVHDYLTSIDKLDTVAKHLGAYDLILADKFPYNADLVARTVEALVGALLVDSGPAEAGLFVQDFILSRLVKEDINELWYFKEPWSILCAYLQAEGRAAPEPRLLREAGRNTVTPVFIVGIYSAKQILGSSAGESEQIALEMASRDCLKRLWQSNDVQFQFGNRGRQLDVLPYMDRPNWTVRDRLGVQIELDPSLYDEPLKADQMTIFYKQNVEPQIGTPYRRRLWHRFYPGTPARKTPRRFIAPKAKTI